MLRNILISGTFICGLFITACHKNSTSATPSSATSTEDLTASARMDSSVNVMIHANDSLMHHHHDVFSHQFDVMFHHADSVCWRNHADYEHYNGHMDTETENNDYFKYMHSSNMHEDMGMHHGAADNSNIHHQHLHDRLDSLYKAHMPLH